MELIIDVNGKKAIKFELTQSIHRNEDGSYGSISVTFRDGKTLKAKILEENIKFLNVLHPLQHIYKTEKGIITVEYRKTS